MAKDKSEIIGRGNSFFALPTLFVCYLFFISLLLLILIILHNSINKIIPTKPLSIYNYSIAVLLYYRIAYQRQAQSPQEIASPESLVGYYQYGSEKKMGVFYRDEQGCTNVHSLLPEEGIIDQEYERSQESCFGNQLRGVQELVLIIIKNFNRCSVLKLLSGCNL